MTYSIQFTKQASKSLEMLPESARNRVQQVLNEVSHDEDAHLRGHERMYFGSHCYRARTGKYRTMYKVNKASMEILVFAIELRAKAYKNFSQTS